MIVWVSLLLLPFYIVCMVLVGLLLIIGFIDLQKQYQTTNHKGHTKLFLLYTDWHCL